MALALVLGADRLIASSGDGAYVERASNVLHSRGGYAKPGSNLPHFFCASRLAQGGTDAFLELRIDAGPAKVLSLLPSPRDASADTFLKNRPLEFGKHAMYLAGRSEDA